MKILIATKNRAKIKKYSTILDELEIEWITINDLEKDINVEENGNTPNENAVIKAKAYYEAFKMPVLADDSGLILDKLPQEKQPGVFVRRHNGRELSDEEIITLYSNEIETIKKITKHLGKSVSLTDSITSITLYSKSGLTIPTK